MSIPDPAGFAAAWLADWNAHDIESLLVHFADDVVFTSPFAAGVVADSGGVLRGKQALRDYWNEGLRRIPDLRFELIDVYAGVDAIVINYRNQNGGLVCEVLVLDGDTVIRGYGTYRDAGENPA